MKHRDINKGFGPSGWNGPGGFRRIVPGVALLLLLAFGVFGLASALLQQEDPVSLVRRKGTAGMKLKDGKSIVVQNGKLYVRSGRTVRALLPEQTRILVKRNTSGINSNGIMKLAEEAAKSKLGNLFNQSYKVHGNFETKGQRGNEKTVVCHLTFEHRNIWYAEERTLEMDVVQSGAAYTLKTVRTPLVAAATPLRTTAQRVARPAAKPVPAKRLAVARPAVTAKAKSSINADVTKKVTAKYPTYQALPIHTILKEFPVGLIPRGPTSKALANTAYPEVVTADEATDQVYTLFLLALGTARKLVGPAESSKDNVLDYLRNDSNLVAWNNIGHGNTSTLFQNGTNIVHTDISGGAAPFQGLSNCVCLVNACQTFNDPLKAAIIGRGPRTYIAGVINLPMVTSEGSNPNFWFKVLFQGKTMAVAYNETNNEAGLNGYWGFWGDSGLF
jgi:hypothetical protein